MVQFIGCDAHKKYSVFVGIGENGQRTGAVRVEHSAGQMQQYLSTLPEGTPIAVETLGSWYWMVDAMEKAGHQPMLTHAARAKKMMGQINKTDKLDAGGLAILMKNGTLPSVWIPPQDLRDQRELPRTRMVMVGIRTKLKNRLQATLAKYNLQIEEVSDTFGVHGRVLLEQRLKALPPETQRSARQELQLLDQVTQQIKDIEKRIKAVVKGTETMQCLTTLPGVGPILSVVIGLEIGSVDRFGSAEQLASYSGTVPRVHSSGGKTFYGRVRPDVNRYLKWAFVEAANVIVMNQSHMPNRHVVKLYQRIRERKGHAKAVVAVARHLAEATYWMLTKKEVYKDPQTKSDSSTQG